MVQRDHAPEVAGSNRLESFSLGETGPPSAPISTSFHQIFYIYQIFNMLMSKREFQTFGVSGDGLYIFDT